MLQQWHQQQQEYHQWAANVWYQQKEYHQWAYYQCKARQQQLEAEGAQLQQQIEEDTKRRLMKFKAKYERVASRKFSNALKIVKDNGLPTELKQSIKLAIYYFDYQGEDSSPRSAVDAHRRCFTPAQAVRPPPPPTHLPTPGNPMGHRKQKTSSRMLETPAVRAMAKRAKKRERETKRRKSR